MQVSRISYDEVEKLPFFAFTEANRLENRINIFEKLSKNGCLLDCEKWASHLPGASKKAEQAALNKDAIKKNIQRQREKMAAKNDNSRVSNARLQRMRDPFTLNDITKSVENGCDVCRLLRSLVLAIFPPGVSGSGWCDPEDLQLEWYGYGFALQARDQKTGKSSSFHFYSPPVNETVLQGLPPGNLLPGDTASHASLSTAKAWIKDCEASHQRCRQERDVPLPKRLLDLGPPNGTQVDTDIRLVNTEGLTGTYICLSHCWGKTIKPIQTTQNTIQSHEAGIPFSALPKTFADAVIFARHLEVRYLWIDSLCIIQDVKDDWQAEAGKMATIYRNSFVTIAATWSPDSQGGCFSKSTAPDLCFRIEDEKGVLQTVIAARCYEGSGITDNMDLFRESFPAHARAWIFQERVLSRRIIYCTRHELQFSCRQDTSCECGNTNKPPHPRPTTESNLSKRQSKQAYADMEYVSMFKHKEQQLHWWQMVMAYTKLQLTEESDKLPAISGCATHFDSYSLVKNGRYLAGLWEARMAQGLLWYVNKSARDEYRRPPWRAPSWSWAAVDTPNGITHLEVNQTFDRQRFQDSIVAVECKPEGVDRTGSVQPGAYMRVHTSLLPTFLRRVCRACMRSRAILWVLESDLFIASRNPNVVPCPTDGHDGLRFGDADHAFYPDYRYKDGDLKLEPRNDGHPCRHARVYLMYLYDKSRLKRHFLVLRKTAASDGSEAYERIAFLLVNFKSITKADKWFLEEYNPAATKTADVTVL